MFREHLEHPLAVIVVHNGVVGELHVGSDGRGGRRVDMVDSALGHLVEDLEEFRILHHLLMLEKVADNNVELRIAQNLLQLGQLLISLTLFLGQTFFKVVGEVERCLLFHKLFALFTVLFHRSCYVFGTVGIDLWGLGSFDHLSSNPIE